jgi:signal transduction histidine kinase
MSERSLAAALDRVRSSLWSLLTAALTAGAAIEIGQGKWDTLPVVGRIAYVVLTLGPLPLVRFAPLAATATITLAADALMLAWGEPRSLVLFFVSWLAAFAAAAYGSGDWRVRATLVALLLSLILVSTAKGSGGWNWSDLVFTLMLFAFSAGLGLVLRGHIERSRVAEDAARREREQAARAAAEAASRERTRIARDLHDIVAHGVSLMVVQAAAASNVLDRKPVQARAAIGAIESIGQRTLGELRRMLDVMHQDDPGVALPQPGLAALEAIVQDARDAGSKIDASITGDPTELPAGVDVTAYRIVQEAVTNARRHAPGASIDVRVDVAEDELRLEVVNGAPVGAVPPASEGGGYGVAGMRERASLYDGRVDVGPTGDGGWRVTGRLRLDSQVQANHPEAVR